MPNLKVKQLEWYMIDLEDPAELDFPEYDNTVTPLGRDGYYCLGNLVWFELNGKAYNPFPRFTPQKAREHFEYSLKMSDELILPEREVNAMKQVLKTTRDRNIKKALYARLHDHNEAFEIRRTRRSTCKIVMKNGNR